MGRKPAKSRAEFEAEKNEAHAALTDLIERHGYEPTMAAAAELLGRRVTDDMRREYAEPDAQTDGGYVDVPTVGTPWPYLGMVPIFGLGWAAGAASFLFGEDTEKWPDRMHNEAKACIYLFLASHGIYALLFVLWWFS